MSSVRNIIHYKTSPCLRQHNLVIICPRMGRSAGHGLPRKGESGNTCLVSWGRGSNHSARKDSICRSHRGNTSTHTADPELRHGAHRFAFDTYTQCNGIEGQLFVVWTETGNYVHLHDKTRHTMNRWLSIHASHSEKRARESVHLPDVQY